MPATTPTPETPTVHLIPLAAIDDAALSRDRTGLDPEPLTELELSIAANGLRQPIELFPLATPRDAQTHGLLSGYRRLFAFRNLSERTGQPRYTTIPAFIRERTDLARSLAAVVEENEIRAGISPFERGLIAVTARNMGAYDSIEEAVNGLYPHAGRTKRHRIRAIAFAADEVGGYFRAPENLSEQKLLRIARAVSAGFGEVIRTALEESTRTDPGHEWPLVEPIVTEAELNERNPEPAGGPGRPRRVTRPAYGVTIRRERTENGWSLHFTGPKATGPYMDLVLDEIDRMYAPD